MNYRFFVLLIILLCPFSTIHAADCSPEQYGVLVQEGKKAAEERDWAQSITVIDRILNDCRQQINESDIAKAYDALATAQLMLEQYPAAIDSAKSCLQFDPGYAACMMTTAKANEFLGDREAAIAAARAVLEVEPRDDYAAAIAIYAQDFLRKLERK